MDINVKGFGILTAYDNKDIGSVAAVGDISSHARTFTSSGETFSDPLKDGGRFFQMYSVSDGDVPYNLPQTVIDVILDVIETVATFDALSEASAQFTDNIATPMGFTNVVVGPSILGDDQHIPSYATFSFTDNANTVTAKVWFSDLAIREEYDEWEVRVVAPLDIPANMYGSYADVNTRINGVTLSAMMTRAKTVRGTDPSTELKPFTLRWIDRTDSNQTIDTEWLIHCYGPLASLQSNIVAGIQKFLVDNTAYTLDQWIEHFPDLVSINVYTFIPLWDKPAIAVSGLGDTIFNPTIKFNEVVDIISMVNPSLVVANIGPTVETTGILYKGIGLIAYGTPENDSDALYFSDVFPDYTVLSVNDSNINRLSDNTKAFIQLLERLVRQAETDDGIAVIPDDMTRATFGGVTVLYSMLATNQIQVVVKSSYLNLL